MTKHILRVDASMRKEGSQSRELADKTIARLSKEQAVSITLRDLTDTIPHVDEAWINANFTDPEARNEKQREVLSFSDTLVSELKQADTLVIATPIYNFGVPAAFKAWIDMIARARETFRYSENGPVGLLEGKEAIVIITSGGTSLNSDIDFVSGWIRHVLGFIGITDVTVIDSSALMKTPEIFEQAQHAINELA
jgi:FMN-dependent NADH-azoreductase